MPKLVVLRAPQPFLQSLAAFPTPVKDKPKRRPKRKEDGEEVGRSNPRTAQTSINACLRALDRSGAPCRRWRRMAVSIRSFTGCAFDVPAWKGDPISAKAAEGQTALAALAAPAASDSTQTSAGSAIETAASAPASAPASAGSPEEKAEELPSDAAGPSSALGPEMSSELPSEPASELASEAPDLDDTLTADVSMNTTITAAKVSLT